MRLDRLELDNFRLFERLDLPLHPTVTVLAGLNASGKSTVLDALAVAMGAWLSGTSNASGEARSILATDARLVRQDQQLPSLNARYPVRVRATGEVAGDTVQWTRELRKKDGRTTTVGAKSVRSRAATQEIAAVEDADADLPLLAYFGTGRRWVEKRRSTSPPDEPSRLDGYAACLEMASQTRLFERWMQRRTQARLQTIAREYEATGRLELGSSRSPHLDAVEEATKTMLDGASRFFYSVDHSELRIELVDGRLLPFDHLSDGQRSLVTLAAELAWRASQLNPHHGSHAAERTRGIVLIDEIELHLHPGWQRTVLERLRRTFPHLQFILSTHSPQVLASAEPEWIRILHTDGQVTGVTHTRGKDTNRILQDIMGVPPRPAWMDERLGRLGSLIENERHQDARQLMNAIRADLGDDPSLLGYEWELADLEARSADH